MFLVSLGLVPPKASKKTRPTEKTYASGVGVYYILGYVRAQSFQVDGVGVVDSQHLAAAEAAGVDYLITTDLKFERVVTRKKLSKVVVINPLTYLVRRP